MEEAVIIWKSSVKKSTGVSTVYVNFYEIQNGKLFKFENVCLEHKRYIINSVFKVR